MFCPKCGNELANVSRYCNKCGFQLNAGEDRHRSGSGSRAVAIAVCIVALVVFGIMGGTAAGWFGPTSPLGSSPKSILGEDAKVLSVGGISLEYPASWGEPQSDSSNHILGFDVDEQIITVDDEGSTSFYVFRLKDELSISWEELQYAWDVSIIPWGSGFGPLTSTRVGELEALEFRGDVTFDSSEQQSYTTHYAFIFLNKDGFLYGGAVGEREGGLDDNFGSAAFDAIMDTVAYSNASDDLPGAYSSTTYIGPGVAPPGMSS